jgi:hypothetical protein
MLSVVADDADQAELRLDLDVLFGEGARRMLAVALEAEVDAYIAGYANQVDERGHRLVVGNGHAQPARSPPASAGSRWRVLGWTTAGWTRPRASGPSSTARSCPGGVGARRRSPRCCRCCACTGCPAPTSSRR